MTGTGSPWGEALDSVAVWGFACGSALCSAGLGGGACLTLALAALALEASLAGFRPPNETRAKHIFRIVSVTYKTLSPPPFKKRRELCRRGWVSPLSFVVRRGNFRGPYFLRSSVKDLWLSAKRLSIVWLVVGGN